MGNGEWGIGNWELGIGNYGELWGIMGNYGELWGIIGNYGALFGIWHPPFHLRGRGYGIGHGELLA